MAKKTTKKAKKTVKKPLKKSGKKPVSKKQVTQKKLVSNIGFIPLSDRVLVLPKTAEEVTSYGLIIPAGTSGADDKLGKEKPMRGVVVAVGEGRRTENGVFEKLSIKAGDEILFSGYGFDEIRLAGREYYLVSAASIFGIIG